MKLFQKWSARMKISMSHYWICLFLHDSDNPFGRPSSALRNKSFKNSIRKIKPKKVSILRRRTDFTKIFYNDTMLVQRESDPQGKEIMDSDFNIRHDSKKSIYLLLMLYFYMQYLWYYWLWILNQFEFKIWLKLNQFMFR